MVSNTNTFHPYGAVLKLPDGDITLVAGNNFTITPAFGSLTLAAQIPPNVVFNNNTPYQPPSLSDGAAPKNSIYFSIDAGKLVYRDSAGSVHNLY